MRPAPVLVMVCLVVSVLLAMASWYGVDHIIRHQQTATGEALRTVLMTTHRALLEWSTQQQQTAELWAQSPDLCAAASRLVDCSSDELPDHPAQKSLRRLLAPLLAARGYRGFFLIDATGRSVGSTRDVNLGTTNLLSAQPWVLERLWAGQSVVSLPQFSDVPLEEPAPPPASNAPAGPATVESPPGDRSISMFVGHLVRDTEGVPVALLTLRIDPWQAFMPLIKRGRLGMTGESYAFDRNGLMLSNSRFEVPLQNIGLLATGQRAPLRIRLSDPGHNLLTTDNGGTREPSVRPLTRMARSAVMGEARIDTTGYRDYRGVPVVGAWLWDEELGLGLCTEQDVAEAHSAMRLVRWFVSVLGASAIVFLISLGLVHARYLRLHTRYLARLQDEVDAGAQALSQSQERFRAIFNSSVQWVMIADATGRILEVNDTVRISVPGGAHADFLGQAIWQAPWWCADSNGVSALQEAFATLIAGEDRQLEIRCVGCATQPTLAVNLHRLEQTDGMDLVIVEGRDISAHKGLEAELRAVCAAESAATRAKDEFLATMSHEIRTPMNGVIGMCGLLLDTTLHGEQREYAETVRSCAESLMELINDILDFSLIESGQMLLDQNAFDPRALLQDLMSQHAEIATRKDLALVARPTPRVPAALSGDPIRLRQILNKLLSNALKFTDSGEVELALDYENHQLRITVRDTGIGMDADTCRQVFEPFVQADTATTRRFGGAGLGLAIVQRLVHLLGGSIDLDSQPGLGSRFRISLPMAGAPASPLRDDLESLRGLEVLVCENDEATRRQIIDAGLTWGLRLWEAHDAVAAMALLRERGPELTALILSEQLPGIDGLMLLRVIQRELTHDLPTILLAQNQTAIDRDQAGVIGCLQCPPDLGQLRQLLCTIEGTVVTEDLPQQHAHRVLIVEDNPVNQRLARLELQRLGYIAQLAHDGRDALAIFDDSSFDLILMDCQMPELDGYETTRILREAEASGSRPRTPIIAMTANALTGDRTRCLAAGMDDYLSKPLRRDDLRRAIGRWLRPAPADASSGTNDNQDPGPLDSALREAIIDQRLFERQVAPIASEEPELIRTCLMELDQDIAQLRQAIEAHNPTDINRAAHRLVSTSGSLGGQRLAELARRIDEQTRHGEAPQAHRLYEQLDSCVAVTVQALQDRIAACH